MLYVIATPLGNLEDISLRALRIFRELDVLACEDTRVTRKIFQRYEIPLPPQIFAYQEYNEIRAGEKILTLLRENKNVGLCSDSGVPAISDPGYRIINSALAENLPLTVIPGASAIETALVASGMPTASFCFHGFLPPKSGKRQNFFRAEKDSPHTMVIYESPTRIAKTLADAAAVLENRLTAICLELTKVYEKITRDYLYSLAEKFAAAEIKGEGVMIIAGNNPKFFRADK